MKMQIMGDNQIGRPFIQTRRLDMFANCEILNDLSLLRRQLIPNILIGLCMRIDGNHGRGNTTARHVNGKTPIPRPDIDYSISAS